MLSSIERDILGQEHEESLDLINSLMECNEGLELLSKRRQTGC